ncbi:MAG: FAD-dependent monooxygenase, partial [Burkholderiales bacterium]
INLVGIVHARSEVADLRLADWDHATNADDLRAALAGCCTALQDLVRSVSDWRLWVLCDRPPMRGSQEHARGRVALIGDAAHPMRPYLAQGAGMAIEDAAALERVLSDDPIDLPTSLATFAAARWPRNARVQARAERNGRIFHSGGLVRWGRDASLQLLGARLLDLPWLYAR